MRRRYRVYIKIIMLFLILINFSTEINANPLKALLGHHVKSLSRRAPKKLFSRVHINEASTYRNSKKRLYNSTILRQQKYFFSTFINSEERLIVLEKIMPTPTFKIREEKKEEYLPTSTLTTTAQNENEKAWFIFSGKSLLLNDKMEIPRGNESVVHTALFERKLEFIHIGNSYIAAELQKNSIQPEKTHLKDFVELFLSLPTETIEPARKACQLLEWDKLHQFCGSCGSRTRDPGIINEPYKICTSEPCKQRFYPKVSPVVIVAVEKGDTLLLARSPHFPPEIYTTLAGFVEPGESAEQAAEREVYEETGIRICNLRYFASQSWQYPTSLTLGFQADYKSGTIVPDTKEIQHADFFHVTALPKTFPGDGVTISQKLIKDFSRRHSKNVTNDDL